MRCSLLKYKAVQFIVVVAVLLQHSWECRYPASCFPSPARNVYAVWRSYLEGTVQVSQSRLNVCDNYKSQVSEPAKTVRLYKEQQLKKVPGLRWSVSLSPACLQDFPSVNQSDSHSHLLILCSPPTLPPSFFSTDHRSAERHSSRTAGVSERVGQSQEEVL